MPGISPLNSKLVAIVSTDVKSSTEITYANEMLALSTIKYHRDILRSLCQIYGGEILASMGDGLIISFDTVDQAMIFAIDFQRKTLKKINSSKDCQLSIKHRIGIHLGLLESHQEFKSSIILIADKLQHEAEPGGICFSRSVYDALQLKNKFPFREGDFFSLEKSNVKLRLYFCSSQEILKQDFDELEKFILSSIPSIQLVAIVFTMIDQYEDLIFNEPSKTYTKSSQDFQFMKEQCRRFGGRLVKTMASGCLLVFNSALNAVYWATKVQRSFLLTQQSNYKHRIAIHLGDIMWQQNDIAGTAVNWSARMIPYSPPGGLSISSSVYDAIISHFPFNLYKVDEYLVNLNGIPHPCRVFGLQQSKIESLNLTNTEDIKLIPRNYVYEKGNDLRVDYEKGVRQFRKVICTNLDLTKLNLSNTDFSRSTLNNIQGIKLNFSNSILNYASFRSSNLSQADLSNSYLKFADLENINLQQANLKGTNFYNANVRSANFCGADLTHAYISTFQLSTAITNQKTIFPDGHLQKQISLIVILHDLARILGRGILAVFTFFGWLFLIINYPVLIFVTMIIVIIRIQYWVRSR